MLDEFLNTGILLKPIPFIDPLDYKAGSDGFIYSKKNRGNDTTKRRNEWIKLAGTKINTGYYQVDIHKNTIAKRYSVHRLVCLAFYGLPKKHQVHVRHLDGNPSNNKPENLKFGTAKENHLDNVKHGRNPLEVSCVKGENHPAAKLTDIETIYVKFIAENKMCTQNILAKTLNVTQPTISRIKNSDLSHLDV